MELLKLEQKKELKRLQRQNLDVNRDIGDKVEKILSILPKMEEVLKKQTLQETSMATVFKLLRIQYALAH